MKFIMYHNKKGGKNHSYSYLLPRPITSIKAVKIGKECVWLSQPKQAHYSYTFVGFFWYQGSHSGPSACQTGAYAAEPNAWPKPITLSVLFFPFLGLKQRPFPLSPRYEIWCRGRRRRGGIKAPVIIFHSCLQRPKRLSGLWPNDAFFLFLKLNKSYSLDLK